MAGKKKTTEAEPFTGFDTGTDMWCDSMMRYGIVAAHCICQRYLKDQSRTTDASEKVFCRELREAMVAEWNMKHIGVYRHDAKYAEQSGGKAAYDESYQTNRQCAGDINEAISFCEYGDGSVDFKTALTALTERYGAERLSFVLACEVNSDTISHRFPNDVRQWARDMNIHESYDGYNMRTRPENLTGLIAELRHVDALLEPQKDAPDHTGSKKPSLLGKLEGNKQRVERDKAAKKDLPVTPKRRASEVTD